MSHNFFIMTRGERSHLRIKISREKVARSLSSSKKQQVGSGCFTLKGHYKLHLKAAEGHITLSDVILSSKSQQVGSGCSTLKGCYKLHSKAAEDQSIKSVDGRNKGGCMAHTLFNLGIYDSVSDIRNHLDSKIPLVSYEFKKIISRAWVGFAGDYWSYNIVAKVRFSVYFILALNIY